MEFNKIFAAVLTACVIAMLAGFVSKKMVHVNKLDEDAYVIEVADAPTDDEPSIKAGPEPILALIATASIEKGQKLSKACAACHNFEKGGAHRLGPNMWDKINAPIGAKEGYAYSDALMAKNAAGVKWTYEDMNAFLYKPRVYAKGTKMSYIGMRKTQDRADMVAWLRSLSDNPAPLPVVEEQIEEVVPEVPTEDVLTPSAE